MEVVKLGDVARIEDVVRCLHEEEEVFAVYEDLSKGLYSIVAWGSRNTVSSSGGNALDEVVQALKNARKRDYLYPLDIGLIGYVSYDAVRLWEKIPDIKPYPEEWPLIQMFEPINMAVYDHGKGIVYVDGDPSLLKTCRSRGGGTSTVHKISLYDSMLDGDKFVRAVEETLKYVRDGYAFQVVISRFQRYVYSGDLTQYYLNLRAINPSPYTYFIKFGDRALIGASPELLFSLRRGVVETYPIAGTRPRGRTEEEDKALEKELMESEKDRAEHLMLVDLARNDIGKVCEPGTVRVEKLMYIEKYSHVQHIVSRVVGALRKRFTAVDVLKAVLPAGTVSGAPKPFAMKLIEELEEYKRGPYAGAVGFFTTSGEATMAIAIRTAFVFRDLIRLQAGAGIVYDSNPHMELEETEHKLAALKKALGIG